MNDGLDAVNAAVARAEKFVEVVPDEDVAIAVIRRPLLMDTARLLTEKHGFEIAQSSVAKRIETIPVLKMLHELSLAAYYESARELANEGIAKNAGARNQRQYGPRCGAAKRNGKLCTRKVELGTPRCRNHGGLSTGPKTIDGKRRSREARLRGLHARRNTE